MMERDIEIVKKILNDFLETEGKINNPDLYKRKWKQFLEEKISKMTEDFTELQAENLLPETLKLLVANKENIGKILEEELSREDVFFLFYSELINYLLLKEDNYEEIINAEGTRMERASFCKVLESFLSRTDDEIKSMLPIDYEEILSLSSLRKEDKEKMVDFAKEVALKLSEVFEEINFSEPDFFEEYLEQFSHEEVDFVEILSVFKECNNFLEEFADYDDELILQKYIEVGDIDEIRIFLSAVFSFIALRKNLKKEDERYPYISGKEIRKLLKK